MPANQPVDQADRDAIRTNIAETLFVEAGAGSGKTFELVRRIIALVASGVPLRSIAAITFTNAAAADLKDRVRFELSAAGGGGSDYARLAPEACARCAEAVSEIDSAAIQTLHSFAQRILSSYPIEAGLPPFITVRDAVAASIAFEDRWQPFLEDLMRDGAGRPETATALFRAFTLGMTERHLRAVALSFHYDWDRVLPATFGHPPMPEVELGQIAHLLAGADRLGNELKPGCDFDYAAVDMVARRPVFGAIIKAHEALAHSSPGADRLAAEEHALRTLNYSGWLDISKQRGRKENWYGTSLRELREVTRSAEDLRRRLLDGVRAAALGPLLTAIQRFVREYRRERIAEGDLEFHDLLVLARDILVANPAVRRGLADRYSALLIDEFQDTDPIQVEIATLVATSFSADPRLPWAELPVDAGRLFFVGDPKQSIYRFRRADIDVYTAAAGHFGAAPLGRTVHLTENFRSAPSVIEWVNHTFATLFTLPRTIEGAQEVAQVRFQPLTASRPSGGPEPAVHLLGGPVTVDGKDVSAMRVIEANAIAAAIAGIRAKPSDWLIGDGPGRRPAVLADIAILLPTRTAQPELEQALNEAGIPYRVESSSLVFEAQEVRDLLSILAAVDDPSDQVAIVAALRCPGFGCSDRDLYDYHRAGGSWDYRQAAPEGYQANGIVAESMRSLTTIHRQRWWLDPAAMVDLVIRERRLFQVAFARRRPRESWRRLRFIHEQARAFSAIGGGLRQFITFVERQADERARMTESVVPEEDDDAVRVLTVHASKGLEFPIVVLAGLNTGASTESPVLLWDTPRGPRVRVGSKFSYFETEGYAAVKEREDAMERLEGDRLLYVAATRARDHLVVSTFYAFDGWTSPHEARHLDGKCSRAECILAISEKALHLWRRLNTAEPVIPKAVSAHVTEDVDDSSETRASWLEGRRALIAANARLPIIAATAIARAAGRIAERADEKAEPAEEDAPWKRGRAGTSAGRAVHAVLQTIDLETGEGLEAAARAQAAAEGVEGREDDIVRYARAALDSAAVRAAIASGRYWREVYVAANIDGITVEGFIDLLYEAPDGLVVVDYKTDGLRDEAAIEAAMARYRLQGAAYALALQESLGRPVAGCTFVFVQPRQERDIAGLAAAMEEVRALLPAALAS